MSDDMKQKRYLSKIVVGYDAIEPTIIGLVACSRNVLLLGLHGNAKTTIAKALASGFGKDKDFQYYCCDKLDILNLAGIPDVNELAKGKFKIAQHNHSVMRPNLSVVVLDELSRANKEVQNFILEMLADNTMFGEPLSVESFIATANPSTYAAACKIDHATMDRFNCVVPIDSFQESTADQLEAMIKLNIGGERTNEELEPIFKEIRKTFNRLTEDEKYKEIIGKFVSTLMATVLAKKDADGAKGKSKKEVYISPRTMIRTVPDAITAIAAYYKTVGEREWLQAGAQDAIRYGLIQKIDGIEASVVEEIFKKLKPMLKSDILSDAGQLRLEWVQKITPADKVKFLKENRKKLTADGGWVHDETTKALGDTMQEIADKKDWPLLREFHGVAAEYTKDRELFAEVAWQTLNKIVRRANEMAKEAHGARKTSNYIHTKKELEAYDFSKPLEMMDCKQSAE